MPPQGISEGVWGGNAPPGNLKLGCLNFVILQKAYMKHQSVIPDKARQPRLKHNETKRIGSIPVLNASAACVVS